MGPRWILLIMFVISMALPTLAQASTGDISNIIEKFVARQFPDSVSHYWVINETQWDGDEMIVDVHTIVQERQTQEPTLSRYLLLIVAGELRGSQNVPLSPGTDCREEEA